MHTVGLIKTDGFVTEMCSIRPSVTMEEGFLLLCPSHACNGAHLFLDGRDVIMWQGGKSTLDGTIYCVDRCQPIRDQTMVKCRATMQRS